MTHERWRGIFEQVRRVQTPKGRDRTGLYSIEGIRLHERALRAGVPIEHVVVAEHVQADASERVQALLAGLHTAGIPITVVPDTAVRTITHGRDLGGLLGLIPIPTLPTTADILASGPRPPLLLVAVDVVDPGNVGALARTAHACGASGLVAVGVSDPFHPKAQRTSMGSLFKLPFTITQDLAALMAELHELDVVTVATAVDGAQMLPEYEPTVGGTAVLMGSEAWGLSSDVLSRCDVGLSIPMADGVDSLSVNAAAAIVLYEMRREK